MERGRKDWIRIQRKPALSEILRTAGAAITPARVLRAPPPPFPVSDRISARVGRRASPSRAAAATTATAAATAAHGR